MLLIPVAVPAVLSAYSVVGEREQGTLEPVLATPIRREEFLIATALAAFVPTLVIACNLFGIFLAAAALLVFDLLAWRVVATMFVRERLVTGRPG
jgi:ABC-type Na+ efflux pump permease subunit